MGSFSRVPFRVNPNPAGKLLPFRARFGERIRSRTAKQRTRNARARTHAYMLYAKSSLETAELTIQNHRLALRLRFKIRDLTPRIKS